MSHAKQRLKKNEVFRIDRKRSHHHNPLSLPPTTPLSLLWTGTGDAAVAVMMAPVLIITVYAASPLFLWSDKP